jgi:hypothetical protein
MKALIVGPPLLMRARQGVELHSSKSFVNSPPLTDFGIIVLQYSKDRMSRRGIECKKRELGEFLEAGGFCVVLPLEVSVRRTASMWCPTKVPSLIPSEGGAVRWKKDSLVAHQASEIPFVTQCVVEVPSDDSITVLARNNARMVVAFSIAVKDGQILFLPAPETASGRRKFVKAQIDHVSNMISQAESKPPGWFADVTPPFETRISDQLSRLRKIKGCLYRTGRPLSKSIHALVEEMLQPLGFNIEYREEEGQEDLCASSSKYEIRFECKGLKGYANVEDLRQLLDHCTRRPSKMNLKGIFIVNHYRDEPPAKRGIVATTEAIDLATANGYLIVSTVSLFGAYLDVLEGRLNHEAFLNRLLSSVGLVDSFSA